MLKDPHKRESLFHAILINSNKLKYGSQSADSNLSKLLREYGTFEEINKVLKGPDPENYSKLISQVAKAPDFKTLTINHPKFPSHLKEFGKTTPVLYVRGNTDLFNEKSMAVVGTRELYDDEQVEQGQALCHRLIKKNYTIVSGLAKGCDYLAHDYAVNNNGNTIAVLGTPIDKANRFAKALQEIIAQDHLLVSQFPIGVRTFPSHFAHRNKTTVGLSTEGICVILASDKSGTQHAMKEVTNQGKTLYVLEQNLHQGYKWPHELKYKVVK